MSLPIKTDWMKKQMAHQASNEYARSLVVLAQKFPFDKALEIGCAWGISTLALLLGCPEGKLTSVDKSYYQTPHDEVVLNGYSERWHFILMDSKDYWQNISDKYDLIYIDGDHSYEYAHLDIIGGWKHLESGGVLAIDDAVHQNNRPDSSDPYGVAIASLEHWTNNPEIKGGFIGRILWFQKP